MIEVLVKRKRTVAFFQKELALFRKELALFRKVWIDNKKGGHKLEK